MLALVKFELSCIIINRHIANADLPYSNNDPPIVWRKCICKDRVSFSPGGNRYKAKTGICIP